MEIIYRKPKTGKTTELIKRCAEKGGYIVCQDMKRAKIIFKMAKEMNSNIPFPLTFHELLTGEYYGKGVRRIYIDNVEVLIQQIASGVEVDSIVLEDLRN
ncbi:MAG: hypothetical protein NC548_58075 [Lachnospiraceae bacterium]|nr:hypothetical protein [Lachnospiraceae bacterium]